MSCWVVPSIAAELWGISVQQVYEQMRTGQIRSKVDAGFTFVDVAPHSPVFETPRKQHPTKPPTYTVVASEQNSSPQQSQEADETIDLGDWRQAREEAQKLRRPPAIAA